MNIVRRYYSTVLKKRFYKTVNVVSNGDKGFEVCLDNKKIKTPSGSLLTVRSEPLALAIAQEWDCQKEKVEMNRMHLTGLAFTCIDNPLRYDDRSLVDKIMNYLNNDTLLFISDEPANLAKLQRERWGEIINWAKKHYEIQLEPTSGLTPPVISAATKEILRRHLSSYNFWCHIGFEYAVSNVKSLLLTLATVQCRLTVEEAAKLSMLEQEFQIARWGRVEWAHDVEYHEHCSRLAAATFFINVNCSHAEIKKKH